MVKKPVVGGDEVVEASDSIEGFHLTELSDDGVGADGGELVFPGAEVEVAPLIVNGVAFPGHIAEARFLRGEFFGEECLESSVEPGADEVGLPHENDDVILIEGELPISERLGGSGASCALPIGLQA